MDINDPLDVDPIVEIARLREKVARLTEENERLGHGTGKAESPADESDADSGRHDIQALQRMAEGIGQDFRSVITEITLNLLLARNHLDRDSGAQYFLSLAEGACQRAATMASELLDFSRPDSDDKRTCALGLLLMETAETRVADTEAWCEFDVAEELWSCPCSPRLVRRAVASIVECSVLASPEGGAIRVAASNRLIMAGELPDLVPGPYVQITISHSGLGIPESDPAEIFNPYALAGRDQNGLGMAMARSIILRHGGTVQVSSLPGEGIVFSVYLPASAELDEEEDTAPVVINLMEEAPGGRRAL